MQFLFSISFTLCLLCSTAPSLVSSVQCTSLLGYYPQPTADMVLQITALLQEGHLNSNYARKFLFLYLINISSSWLFLILYFVSIFILFCTTLKRSLFFLRRQKQQQRQQQRVLMHLSAFFAWADVFPTPITILAKVSQLFCLVRVAKKGFNKD